MNINTFFYLNTTPSVSPAWHYASGGYAFLCLLCGSISNGLVIFVFIRNSNLRQPRNFLLINLAVTDLGLLLTNNPLHIIASFNKQWPFGHRGCSFYALCGGVFGLTAIATMAAIAVTRLVAVINPLSSLKLTEHFILKCIVCSWIYGSMWMIPPLFGWNRFVFEGFGTSCTFDYISKDGWNRSFMIILVVGGFFIPLTIIIVSYTFILMRLSKRDRYLTCRKDDKQRYQFELKQSNTHHFAVASSSNNEVLQSEPMVVASIDDNQVFQKMHHIEARATRTAMLVCAIYCIAWGPYALMAVLAQIGLDQFITVYTTATLGLFAKTAACINPLVYAFSSPIFRPHLCCSTKHSHQHVSVSENSSNKKNLIIKTN